MSLRKLMTNYVNYNWWANKTIISWLSTKQPELLNQEVPSSFSSMYKTIEHIWDTERFWLHVLKAISPPVSFRYQPFQGNNEDVMNGLLNQSEDFSNFVQGCTDIELLEECNLDTPWVKGQLPKYEFIQHCMNHSSYHRGQIITIGRNTGITDAPMTDYNFYNMSVLKAKDTTHT